MIHISKKVYLDYSQAVQSYAICIHLDFPLCYVWDILLASLHLSLDKLSRILPS